ncbi:chromate efflux transporter [Pseudoroseicyclus tamaricis]|uniref:Chromate efflux transporter n=1 Tax=Pseudoroseicyclus tamaricis TaxID=2705421 RepID=A0A6B2K4M0_9RHOB|nr:chromate efflux transporter [Pseudoroseicyclus tamaricis]NDV01646.1 chromate efflux transporter [Pseudoroseicyclus tamaricis]
MTLRALTLVFLRIGCLSFGGPAAQIALMQRELVERRPWLTEAEFLRALSFCMLLPGPEAMQLATYAGWRLRGTLGGLVAGSLFVLPGAAVIAALALAYAAHGDLPAVRAAFTGIQAAVIAIVVLAILRLGSKALKTWPHRAIALLAFLALYAAHLPFPLVILAAGAFGFLTTPAGPAAPRQSAATPWALCAALLALWAAPLIAAWGTGADLLLALGLFFSKLALVTFGGAYAVLAWMTDEVVRQQGWLTAAQMLDALGLAETTPGPLILVTEFVGILAGQAEGIGLLAGGMVLWVTFVPCFLWIFAFAPHIEALTHAPRLSAALAAISAAVVGVIANLSLWFALQVLFGGTVSPALGPLSPLLPVPGTLQPGPLVLAIAAGLALRAGLALPLVLALSALGGLGLAALTGA